eukprot:c9465_g1_i1 orf=414-731(-)
MDTRQKDRCRASCSNKGCMRNNLSPQAKLLKTFEELDNGDGNLLGNFNLEVDDSLHLELVKGKRTNFQVWEAVKFATNHAIDFSENLPSAFAGGGVPPHDDGLVV